MNTKRVIVSDYDDKWKEQFNQIKEELEAALSDQIISIEHVGSTSVAGLAAKPIIDIDLVIKDTSYLKEVINRLSEIGYTYEGDLGIKDREAFKYTGKEHLQRHHLYVCPQNSEELNRHLTFRDYLRNNPDAVKLYGRIKKEGAALYPDDIDKYIEYKSACISEIYRKCGLE